MTGMLENTVQRAFTLQRGGKKRREQEQKEEEDG